MAQQEALELNQRYEELRARAVDGISRIKALDENEDASRLCREALDGAQAIIDLRNFEEECLGSKRASASGQMNVSIELQEHAAAKTEHD